jgi:hypothetical protein
MLTALALTAVALPTIGYGVHRFERWSRDREARAAQIRAEDAVFVHHPGADEAYVVQLQVWRRAGLGSAVAR